MDFELLYFDDCPSWRTTAVLLEAVIERLGLNARIELVRVETAEAAQDARFVGSPSIRLNGEDLFPVDYANYALGCRVYETPVGLRAFPTEGMLVTAIQKRRMP